MKSKFFALALAFGAASAAQAADFSFSGDIAYHNDVIQIPFTLTSDATNVKVWTDSFLNGVNFDPITAVWNQATGALVGQNDDNGNIAPGQTRFDSGLVFSSLAAGEYIFTIATYNNFATGTNINQGFKFDHDAPIALSAWNQPANHPGMGSHWNVHLTGVDGATPPVPEPETYAMLLAGLGLLGAVARRKANKSA
ncbi:PEP-CTERM sorting domain-containing protein [Chitinimonas arctica]|uniref:PEP-CTERM sorting domain-containing protein n=1 Tax=Chitinimonas arctica TaxID=2594795 RepID=A0A516SER1_9NEIS|nr:DVUA0089 family protein [Chitinimonas arctica]QDQ26642.1 PEP-CTERM sorting domain-containing protein [Chitinimonas arctica]